MSCDVKSAHRTTTGALTNFRTRLKGIVVSTTDTAGSLVFRNKDASGATLLTIVTTDNEDMVDIPIPDNGMLFPDGVHVTLSNTAAVTVFYAG